jgi:cyclopropane fatty-acyl-phospholipid synthase-like methyltransferase
MDKWLYEFMYRIPFIPISWIFGAAHEQKEYMQLFENGSIPVGQAIDIGCGEGSNAIYLSRKGFDVTGVDFSPTAIKRAISNAESAGEEITFIEDDLTNLHRVNGKYDLLVDFGALNDLNPTDRDAYMENVLPLTHPSSSFVLLCFTKSVPTEEVEDRFGNHFNIANVAMRSEQVTSRTVDLYFMTN